MLDFMIGSFALIWEFLCVVQDILAVFVRALYLLIVMLFKGFIVMVQMFQVLPEPLIIGFIMITIVCVIYKILGRESQS